MLLFFFYPSLLDCNERIPVFKSTDSAILESRTVPMVEVKWTMTVSNVFVVDSSARGFVTIARLLNFL